jgi:hypothetical protein
MRIELDWQEETEKGEWETVAAVTIRPLNALPRWAWIALLLTLVVATGGIAGALRYRYVQALQRMTFQIQSVIDLEALALERQDAELFLAQQDRAAPGWYDQQQYRLHAGLLPCGADRATPERPTPDYAAAARAQVQEVDLRGDIAWVEVTVGDGARRQAYFYRQTPWGWLHTAPRVEFWGDPVQLAYDGAVVHAYERDVPYIAPLVEHAAKVMSGLWAALGSDAPASLDIHFVARVPPDQVPDTLGTALVLPSPWLSGIPLEGQWDEGYLADIAYWTAYSAALQYVHRPLDASSGDAVRSGRPRQAILDEYALLYSAENVALPPALQRLIERHGLSSLPEALRSALILNH